MGGKMYGIVFCSFGTAAITSALIQKFAVSTIGYEVMFWILGGMSLVSLVILWLVFEEKSKWTLKRSATNLTEIE
jgi:predicted MFS family arabinose efflux permease